MKRKQPTGQLSPSGSSKQFTHADRARLAGLLQAVPTVVFNLSGEMPKASAVAELLGISKRTLSGLQAGTYKTVGVIRTMHTRLSMGASADRQKINRAVRQAIRLDEFLQRYFPAIAEAAGDSHKATPAHLGKNASPAASMSRASSSSPEISSDLLRVFAFAQGMDAAQQKKLESVRACSSHPLILDSKARLMESFLSTKETLEAVARPIAQLSGVPLDSLRAHIHVIGTAHDRRTNTTAPALLPFAYFTLVRSLDSTQPVFMDLAWYSIVHCVKSERAIVHTVDLEERPNTAEALEVPAIECVVAHPLRHRVTGQVIGVLSFDCIAVDESQARPAKSLAALRWGKPDSDHPSAPTKSMLQQLGSSFTRALLTENLHEWLGVNV